MNKYLLIKAPIELDIETTAKNLGCKCVDITKEINESGLTQNGFLTMVIDELKEAK